MRKAWLSGLVVLLAAAGRVTAEDWSHQYPLKGRPELRVTTDDGSVRIETGDRREIEAEVTTVGWRIGPGEVVVNESQSGDRVDIEVRLPRRHFSTGHRSVRVTLRVPREADLDVRTGDGGVTVQPVSGRIRVFTGDGNITAEGLRGDVRLQTGDGSIEASGLDGRVAAETSDGHMRVRGRFDLLELGTGDGTMEVEVEPGSRVASGWSLHSGDGNITLRLPDDLSADLDAHTGDGRIDLELPVTVAGTIGPSTVRGRLGNGGSVLKVHTGDGSIRLRRL